MNPTREQIARWIAACESSITQDLSSSEQLRNTAKLPMEEMDELIQCFVRDYQIGYRTDNPSQIERRLRMLLCAKAEESASAQQKDDADRLNWIEENVVYLQLRDRKATQLAPERLAIDAARKGERRG